MNNATACTSSFLTLPTPPAGTAPLPCSALATMKGIHGYYFVVPILTFAFWIT